MERIWLQSYLKETPPEIYPDQYQSLLEVFDESCARYGNLPAFSNLGVTLSYQQLNQLTFTVAGYLQQVLKLKKGARLALMLPNLLQYPVMLFGALRAGLVIVNINPLYTVPEVAHQLKDSGAEAIIVLANFAHTVEKAQLEASLKHVIVTQVGDLLPPLKAGVVNFILKYLQKKIPSWHMPSALKFKQILADGQRVKFQPVSLVNEDIAFLQYTGGTTGVAKGAILTHRNIIANILQTEAWFKSTLQPGKEVIVSALPLYHIFALMANCLLTIKLGALSILITDPRNISQLIKNISKFKFTVLTGVNTLFNALLKHPDFACLDFKSLKLTLGGGMAVQKVIAEKWQQLTGVPLLEAYGLTEASPCVAINPANIEIYNGAIGLPVSSTEVCILDDAKQEVLPGQIGELAVRGPQVMRGYWQNPLESAKVLIKDGWLLTGDIASIDDRGFVRVVDRKKDMILVSGFNVYPNEIEAVIIHLRGIREVAVIGVPDANTGEAVKALIVRDDVNLSVEDILNFCHENLTPYKVPKHIEFCKELPKTNVGKILKRVLRDSPPTASH